MRPYLIYLSILLLFAIGLPLDAGHIRHSRIANPSPDYVRGINAALDSTLIVGSDMRSKGKRPTWIEIDREVCKRLGVKRDEFFLKVASRQ